MKFTKMAMVAAIALLGYADSAGAGGIIINHREGTPMPIMREASMTNASAAAFSLQPVPVAPAVQPAADELVYAQIRSGLITEEEAQSGCGGASAAAGPAGLLPLGVAALGLLRRRSR